MTTMATPNNPFRRWSKMADQLKAGFVKELGDQPFSDYSKTLLGDLAALGTRCEHLAISLERFEHHDPEGFKALLRALETVGNAR